MNEKNKKLVFDTERKLLEICKTEYEKKNIRGLYNSLFLVGKYLYTFNLKFFDANLEKYIRYLSDSLIANPQITLDELSDEVVFFDSLGLSNRGLSRIYIEAIINNGKTIRYITYSEHYEANSEIREFIENTKGCKVYYVDRNIDSIAKVYDLIKTSKAIFLYTYPEDVIALCAAYKAIGKTYLINFTDHAFWYGATLTDYDIEFRDFGINVSIQERGISENRIIKLPYYPLIDEKREFEGFPDSRMNKHNTIFSGGSVYKTLDDSNLYYDIIDKMMHENDWLFFWYAGFGDYSKLNALQDKYPNRFFITGERPDLFQIMSHSRLFVNTYPMIGGLMSQYAIAAGVPALSLISDDSETGVLLQGGEKCFEYINVKSFNDELHRLIVDDDYYRDVCSQINAKELIMTKESFEDQIGDILRDNMPKLLYQKKDLDFSYFRSTYIQRFNKETFYKAVCKKNFYGFSTFWKYYFALACLMITKRIKRIGWRKKCKL